YDICTVQEPYIDYNGKSQPNQHWITVYPSIAVPPGQVACSLLLVNSSISTNSWSQILVPSSDITAIQLQVAGGCLFLISIW
ncbi:hypothetical protein BDQ17DRAFT_1195671, partial [Cyathus striatus]